MEYGGLKHKAKFTAKIYRKPTKGIVWLTNRQAFLLQNTHDGNTPQNMPSDFKFGYYIGNANQGLHLKEEGITDLVIEYNDNKKIIESLL